MKIDLLKNGNYKKTVDIDIDNMTHGQWCRELYKQLEVPFHSAGCRYNIIAPEKYFDVLTRENMT